MQLFLIPTPLGEHSLAFFSDALRKIISEIDYFFVENERTARRFIGSLSVGRAVQEFVFYRVNKRTSYREVCTQFLEIPAGSRLGVLSEAGCPCIADPGALVVRYAHERNYEVIPLPGPSSIFMALMASGLGGQQFAFAGYLPQAAEQRQQTLKNLEQRAAQGQTQIFMETPYRNQALWTDILQTCRADTLISVAAGLHTPAQFVRTKTVRQWQKSTPPDLHKTPAIFSLAHTF